MRQRRRRRSERLAHRSGGDTDRARIVVMAGLGGIGWRNGYSQPIALIATARMVVSKGQRKVQRQRHQRKPRTQAYVIPE